MSQARLERLVERRPESVGVNELELADLHLDALYHLDAAGLISSSRDPQASVSRFHLFRAEAGNRILILARLDAPQRERLRSVLSSQPSCACAQAEARPPNLDAIRRVLAEYSPPVGEYRGPAFVFPEPIKLPELVGRFTDLRRAPGSGPFAWLRDCTEAIQPVVVVRADDGTVASVCHSARSTSRAAEAGVETIEAFRGRGYGTSAVAAWAAEVRREGRVPLYSTEWKNAASRALARRIGLVCYGEDLHLA